MDRLIMHKLYLSSSFHSLGDILRGGPFLLGPPTDVDGEEKASGYIVVPLTEVGTDDATGCETAGSIRIVARLSDVDPATEEHLPSLNFDLSPDLEPFLNGYPFPRVLKDDHREHLVAPVGKLDDVTMFLATRVVAKRKQHIKDGLLTFRQAFKQSPYPVFLTLDFFSYSLRQHRDYEGLYLPPRGLRYPHLFRKLSSARLERIKKQVKSWNF